MTRIATPISEIKEHYDVIVIGSGYGGGIAASRLSRAGKRVCLLERGREIQPGEYPNTMIAATEELPKASDQDAASARLQTAERLVAEGADKPFLALQFIDAQHGLIVGAYGLALRTEDGGNSWHSLMGQIDNPMGAHLSAIAQQGEHWFLAGEQGFLARSDDGGHSFSQLQSPYPGSFFTLQLRDDGVLLVAGSMAGSGEGAAASAGRRYRRSSAATAANTPVSTKPNRLNPSACGTPFAPSTATGCQTCE